MIKYSSILLSPKFKLKGIKKVQVKIDIKLGLLLLI